MRKVKNDIIDISKIFGVGFIILLPLFILICIFGWMGVLYSIGLYVTITIMFFVGAAVCVFIEDEMGYKIFK